MKRQHEIRKKIELNLSESIKVQHCDYVVDSSTVPV